MATNREFDTYPPFEVAFDSACCVIPEAICYGSSDCHTIIIGTFPRRQTENYTLNSSAAHPWIELCSRYLKLITAAVGSRLDKEGSISHAAKKLLFKLVFMSANPYVLQSQGACVEVYSGD